MAQRFVDDDQGYRLWVENNPDGYVLNTERIAKAGYLVLHGAECSFITGLSTCNDEVASTILPVVAVGLAGSNATVPLATTSAASSPNSEGSASSKPSESISEPR